MNRPRISRKLTLYFLGMQHPPDTLAQPYEESLRTLSEKGLLRYCRTMTSLPRREEHCYVVNGQEVVNFCSNNYLGLAEDPRLKQAAMDAIDRYGVGSGASRLVSGTSDLMVALEESIAEFKSTEKALVFNSGYQANVSILQAILDPEDWVFCDKLNHASLVDGCILSGARWARYRHLDLNHLESRLKAAEGKLSSKAKKWIVTDSVFSMDGDLADLREIAELAERYGALVMVDEAHATGLYGEKKSSGLCEAQGISERIALQMGTLSKALGGFGAYVAGSKILMDTLVNKARGFIYSTALPPAVIGTAIKAVELVQTDPSMRTKLWENMTLLAQALTDEGLPYAPQSAIFPVILQDASKTVETCEKLLAQGYFVQGIRPPTVPEGTSRLRVTLSATHSKTQILGLMEALKSVL